MLKTWQVIKHEYTRHVFEKRFLFSLLSLPGLILAMALVFFIISLVMLDRTPIGFVDLAGVLVDPQPLEQEGTFFDPQIDFISFPGIEEAQTALDEGTIQAFYIIPETYPDSLNVELVFYEQPDPAYQSNFNQFVRKNMGMFDDLDPIVQERLKDTSLITVSTLDRTREMVEGDWLMMVLPFIAGVIFIIVVLTSGGYLLQAVVEEKENRTMEIVITSISPNQLMTGKIIGNIGVGLTQLVVWFVFGWIALLVGGQFWPFLQDFSLPADYVLVMALVMIPSFIMIAAIMSAIGSTMTEMQEAQQISGMFSLLITIPFYVVTPIMNNPNGILARVLSFFPFSAPITLLMRMGFTVIPIAELAISIGLLVIFSVLAIWFAGRVFHMGMLRYGKKLTFKEIFRKKVQI
jgi:ABC-2 type transport system permease protein